MKDSKKTFIWALIFSGILSIILPIFIHIAFKLESPEGSFITSKWEAGDMLSYCGSIIGSVIVVITVWYTLKTSNDETRKTIEASQNQFSIDMAINTFMEYADTVSFDRLDKCVPFYKTDSQISKLNLEQEAIHTLRVSIISTRDKTFFFLNDDEKEYLISNTPKVQTTSKLLNEMYNNLNKIITLKTQYQYKEITENEYEKQIEPLSNKNDTIFKELTEAIVIANSEILTHLRIIIDRRLEEKDDN